LSCSEAVWPRPSRTLWAGRADSVARNPDRTSSAAAHAMRCPKSRTTCSSTPSPLTCWPEATRCGLRREAWLLRPLPLPHALIWVAQHMDPSCLLPVQRARKSPKLLAARCRGPEQLRRLRAVDWAFMPTVEYPLCWHYARVRHELGPGHVPAAISALYAARYDASHLLLRSADQGRRPQSRASCRRRARAGARAASRRVHTRPSPSASAAGRKGGPASPLLDRGACIGSPCRGRW
jgi:hypothetical protein